MSDYPTGDGTSALHPNGFEPIVENSRRSIRYSDGVDEVLVVVPWGTHTALIPPPSITFANRWFSYDGDGPDISTPPGTPTPRAAQ